MDKQIVDIDGRKVVRVNDLRLDEVDGALRLVAVDVGTAGLLRRLGVEGGFRTIARGLGRPVPERYIDWEDVDPVETSIASIKLRVPHQGLAELHPADLATIIDQLAPRDRAGVLASLDDEAVADAIEEMEPDTQVEVLEDLAPERAADILEEMSPDDAADLVADLSDDDPRRDPGADGVRREGRGPGAAQLPRGHRRRDHDDRVRGGPGHADRGPDDRPAARARAGRRDDLLRLRHRRRRPARRRALAARPDRRAARHADLRGDDPRAGRGRRPGRRGRGRRGRRPLQPAGRAGRRRRRPAGRDRHRRRRDRHGPAERLEEAPPAPLRAARSGRPGRVGSPGPAEMPQRRRSAASRARRPTPAGSAPERSGCAGGSPRPGRPRLPARLRDRLVSGEGLRLRGRFRGPARASSRSSR